MEDVEEVIDQPRIKRVKYSGMLPIAALILILADASIQKRSPLHPSRSSSPTRRKVSGRPDEETGLCIYLNRQSSLHNIAERIQNALEDGKNSK
jgi:hypothetical protein